MNRPIASYLVAAISLLLPLLVGCSLIGLGIGAAKSKPEMDVSGWDMISIAEGRKVTITFKDLRQSTGRFGGFYRTTEDEYASQYAAWLNSGNQHVGYPALGSKITVTPVSGRNLNGIFHGFDQERMYVSVPGKSAIWMLEDVVSIADSTGAVLPRDLLFDEISFGTVPLYTKFKVATPAEVRFDSREVETVKVHANNAALTGFLVGAVIDVGIVIAVVATSDDWSSSSSSSSSGSCPFVYSYDGQDFVFDAEPLSSVVFKGAQRSDFHRLNHLKASDGKYRIRFSTELDETDYIDHVSLRVVDHPEGSEIVPTSEGELVLSHQRIAPVSAVQFSGLDVLDAVRLSDSELWVSNPFGRNLTDPTQLRDGLVLEFPGRDGARSATLITTMRAQQWTELLPGKMDKLMGDQLEAMHNQMENDPAMLAGFYEHLDREVLPKVEVWSGSEWHDVGRIKGVSPFILTDRALRFDLPHLQDDVTRVRISSMAGMWVIDQVAMDFEASVSSRVVTIAASEAIDNTGADVLAALATIDGNYYAMPGIGSQADVVFEAPPVVTGLARTVVLETNGYYRVHVEPEGPPQIDMVRRLIVEPSAFSQWALEGLYEQMDALALAGY